MDKDLQNLVNEYAEITFSAQKGNTVEMTVKIPEEDPRKNIPTIVFNKHTAAALATAKYGNKFSGNLSGPTLENRLVTNVLEGKYTLEMTPTTSKTKTASRTRRASKTTTKQN